MWRKVSFLLAVVVFVVYFLTSGGATPYDYFIRLATSFLHGKYYLDTNPSWLNELIPIANGKFAVVYPPAPAIVAMPFVMIFGKNFQQQMMSQIMGAFAAYIWGLIGYKKSGKKLTSLWLFLLASFGNIVWYMSSNGSVWYLGQVSAYVFLTLTIYESLNKKRIALLVLYFSLGILSRLEIVLALPFVLYLNWSKFKEIKKFFSFLLGLSFFGIVYAIYNFLRFGSFLQTGYILVPGILKEPWYQYGLFSPRNIVDHLKIIFLGLPKFIPVFPFIEPSWGGLAIWITSPVFIYALCAKIKERVVQLSWISITLISLLIFSHGETGFTQFGYRFAVDFYPLILFLIVEGVSEKKLKWHHWSFLAVSVIVNLWGVLWINKFGWVGF